LDLYWKPIYCYIRRTWGKTNEEAKDLTQEFLMAMVLERALVEKFDPERGSFRVFLRTAITNFMRDDAKTAHRQKRGGGRVVHGFEMNDLVANAESKAPDEVFDEAWRNVVFEYALESLQGRLPAPMWEAFRLYDLESIDSYEKVAEALGLTVDTVRNHLHRARQEFRAAVRDVVAEYAGDLDGEVRQFLEA
jgi:RNA polymerase sigma factor (sigma-70 family)